MMPVSIQYVVSRESGGNSDKLSCTLKRLERFPLNPKPIPKGLSFISGFIFSLLISLTLKDESSLLKVERTRRIRVLLFPILVWVKNSNMMINSPPAINKFFIFLHRRVYTHNPAKGTATALRVPDINNP